MGKKLIKIIGLLLLLLVIFGIWYKFKNIPPKKIALDNWQVSLYKGPVLDVNNIQKPALVNFWASWCKPCVEEFPVIEAVHKATLAKHWSVMAFTYEDTTKISAFLKDKDYSFNFGSIVKGAHTPEVNSYPTTYFVSPKGEVVWRHVGMLEKSADEIIAEIEEAVAKSEAQ